MRCKGLRGADSDDGYDKADAGQAPAVPLSGIGTGVHLALGGGHVNDVILLYIVKGGVEEVLAAQVEGGNLAVAVYLAHNLYGAVAVDGKVAGLGDSLENSDALTVDGVDTGGLHFADDRELEVADLHVDGGIRQVTAIAQSVGDVGSELGAGLAGGMNATDDGQYDVAVGIHQIAVLHVLAIGLGATGAHLAHVEGGGKLGLLAAHGNSEQIVLLNGGLVIGFQGLSRAGGDILQVYDFSRAHAGATEPEPGNSCAQQKEFAGDMT